MSKKKANKTGIREPDDTDEMSLLGKISRSLEILVRLNLHTMRGDRSQSEMISMLDSVGCGGSEIAKLLGTTANTVNVSLHRAKRKAGKK